MDQETLSRPHRFECMRCNQCCSGQPGYVWLSQKDLDALSSYLHVSRRAFALDYCTPVNIGLALTLSLKEKKNHDCIFLESGGCTVYRARPAQCRTYPFWETILENEQSWTEEGRACPGIGRGPAIPAEAIVDAIVERRQNPPLSIGEVAELKGLEVEWDRQ
jgi:Fe-S-cluster containining protein